MKWIPGLLVFLSSVLLNGQAPPPQSRWITTVNFGLDVGQFAQDANTPDGVEGNSRLATVGQHFRLTRFFDIGIQLGFQRTVQSGSRDFIDEATGLILLSNWTSLRKNTMFGIQPRLNYRIGQGDLGFAPGAGVVHHRNLTSFRSPELGRADFRSTPITDFYFDLNVSYTYWPTPHFGILIGIVYTDLRHQGSENTTDAEGNYIFTAQNFINTTQAFDQEAFRFQVANSRNIFVNLGLVHRW